MEFEQKAEEKKMSMSKNIARLAVTAGLTAALSFGGVVAPVTMAFAAEGGTGSITISQVEGNKNTTFKAYQIFKATVTDSKNGGKTAQNITWASDTVDTKVIDAINSWENDHSLKADDKLPNKPTPQEVADFITAHAGDCTAGSESTKGTRIATDNILYAVANAIRDEAPVKSDIVAGTAWTPNDSGYYLFVTNALSDSSKKDTGTSPIFAVVGGNAVTVTEKTSIPTVGKQVLASAPNDPENATGWAGVIDSQIGQEVTYKLTGSVADNYATYDSYAYKFTDTLSKGLTYTDNSVVVYAVNKDSSNQDKYELIANNDYTTSKANNDDGTTTLTIEFGAKGEKKGLKDISSVNADTQIVVFYKAKLNASANIAGANNQLKVNPNTVTLEYSNNPMSGGTGTSASDTVEDYTYGLKINKVDLGTERALNGAKFTIKVKKADDETLTDMFVQGDGTLSASEHVFETDNGGYFTVRGLDAGTYTVTEKHLDGYADISPFDFEIVPTISDDGTKIKINKIALSMSQTDKLIAGINDNGEGKVGDNKLEVKTGTATNDDGTFNITVGDTKQVGLPLTGLNGVTFTWIAGGAVLCIGVAHLIRSRKQAEESEQE